MELKKYFPYVSIDRPSKKFFIITNDNKKVYFPSSGLEFGAGVAVEHSSKSRLSTGYPILSKISTGYIRRNFWINSGLLK